MEIAYRGSAGRTVTYSAWSRDLLICFGAVAHMLSKLIMEAGRLVPEV